MRKLYNKYKVVLFVLFISLILVGCVNYDAAGNPTGWVYDYLGKPTAILLDWIAHVFGNSYGMAIIIVTIITRLLMLPSSLKMMKNSMMSSAKMELAQPEIKEIQAEMEATDNPQLKAELQRELMAVYKKYDINMFGDTLGGCLPLIIQMPIISAVYAAIKTSQAIESSSFLGIPLGTRSILMVILVVLIYFAQGWLMQNATAQTTVNEQAKQTSKTMMLLNPVMLGWITWASAAGLGLYFLTGGVFAVAQQLYINNKVRPKIEEIIEEQKKVHQRKPQTKRKRKVNLTQTKENSDRLIPTKQNVESKKRRNEGKQKRK